jgi:hypothetical protein
VLKMEFRNYDPTRDKEFAHRLWLGIGWLEKGKEEAMDIFLRGGHALVADVHGEVESLAVSMPGTICYLDEELPFSAVTSVATSRRLRRRGLAKHLTAKLVASDTADGALVAGLGVFEQGFYDRLGFGTGGYEHWMTFDPAQLKLDMPDRLPRRITPDDWASVHAARLRRRRVHGSCNLSPAAITRSSLLRARNGFGFGYCDGTDAETTHCFWGWAIELQHGPYNVSFMAYQTWDQFLELLALLKTLQDQIWLVRMREPPGIQFQDLLQQPFRRRGVSEKAAFETGMRAVAYWQVRVCDLAGCLARTHLRGREVRFNLTLADPIEEFLGDDAQWRGIGGDYVVTLGPSSGAEPGRDETLPTLSATVGAFTRMWLAVRPATSLAVTDALSGPHELLQELDWVLRLPEPKWDWDF